MKLDEFAFVNQQLASMLQDGIPLEGALRQLCSTMQRGKLRSELEALSADLAAGKPLREALAARRFPAFYVYMLRVGAESNDLPGVLTLLADYYQRLNTIWVRLKGLMVYPAIVLGFALVLSVLVTIGYYRFLLDVVSEMLGGEPFPAITFVGLWGPFVIMAFVGLLSVGVLATPALRQWLRWRLPAFREASLSQMAAAMAVMLKGGCTLDNALGLLQRLEGRTSAGDELGRWQARLAGGHAGLAEITAGSRLFPDTFLWLIANARENPAAGFARAAQIYQARAVNRVDMLLYSALPASILFLGGMLSFQFVAMMQPLISIVNKLGAS
jgi:type IV pilus assembly protein PilC